MTDEELTAIRERNEARRKHDEECDDPCYIHNDCGDDIDALLAEVRRLRPLAATARCVVCGAPATTTIRSPIYGDVPRPICREHNPIRAMVDKIFDEASEKKG